MSMMEQASFSRFRRAWKLRGPNLGLIAAVWWNLLCLAGGLLAMPFDTRRILGLNPWIKPMKFEISIVIFLLTIALLLDLLGESGRWRRTRAWLGWGMGGSMVIEITIIAMQSARGVPSHMNYSSVFNAALFAIMGQAIAINTALVAVLLVLFCVTPLMRPAAEMLGIRLGLALLLIASLEGVRMVVFGSHTVGAPDGGPGLPFVNWSTRHGDLRVAHFFALHALQVLWFIGWRLSHSRVSQVMAVATTWLVALAYAGGVWVLFSQAMAARPLLGL